MQVSEKYAGGGTIKNSRIQSEEVWELLRRKVEQFEHIDMQVASALENINKSNDTHTDTYIPLPNKLTASSDHFSTVESQANYSPRLETEPNQLTQSQSARSFLFAAVGLGQTAITVSNRNEQATVEDRSLKKIQELNRKRNEIIFSSEQESKECEIKTPISPAEFNNQ